MKATIALIATVALLYLYLNHEEYLDTTAPTIHLDSHVIYINKDSHLSFNISDDDAGIKSYRIFLTDGKENILITKKKLKEAKNNIVLDVPLPKIDLFFDKKNAQFVLEVKDNSWWILGNKTTKEVKVVFDYQNPQIQILKTSKTITKGGSALVVFEVKDDYLDSTKVYIQTNFDKKFYPMIFYKKGYFISLIAWPIEQQRFSVDIIAYDKAANISKKKIPIYKLNKSYRTSTINISNRFLNGKINSLYSDLQVDTNQNTPPIAQFKYVNETQRNKDEDTIHEVATTQTDIIPYFKGFAITPFYPLKSAAKVASFGDFRYYKRYGKKVSFSYHKGLDLASVKRDVVVSTNAGRVVFADFNGIYGNTVIIDHSLGLYSLYSHASKMYVLTDALIKSGQKVARTGTTGLALGDHIHFGILVQGIEVRPEEWMDKLWINSNIDSVIDAAQMHLYSLLQLDKENNNTIPKPPSP